MDLLLDVPALSFQGVAWLNTHTHTTQHTLCPPGNNVRFETKFIEHVDDHHTTGTKTTSVQRRRHSREMDGKRGKYNWMGLFRLWTVFYSQEYAKDNPQR